MLRKDIGKFLFSVRNKISFAPFSSQTTHNVDNGSNKKRNSIQKTYSFMNVNSKLPKTSSLGGYLAAKTAEDAVNNLLYNISGNSKTEKKHTLSVFVDNEAGVLSKVSGLLSARGFNIDSLSVANTDVTELSRMTIVLSGPEEQMEQAKRQLTDLCDVWAVFDYNPETTVERELCLVKVSCVPPTIDIQPNFTQAEEMGNIDEIEAHVDHRRELNYDELMAVHFHRQALQEIAHLFEAKVMDIGSETIIMELVSWPSRVDGFIKMLRPFKIVEAARTGIIAMARSKVNSPEDTAESGEEDVKVDLAALPPS